jgi:regulator of protease activity HflC (stomatin/prohibitin superfamily)
VLAVGLEKLIELVEKFLEFFRFCEVIDSYQCGVHLRKGKFLRRLEPGIRFQLPFYIDSFITETGVTQVYQGATQSLVTKDGKAVAVGAVITYHIHNPEKALLEVHDVNTAICDACFATIAEQVAATTWDDIRTPAFADDMTAACRKLGFKYGIEVERVRFNELAPLRTYRLITGT